ncbi:hypothetical protein PVNG_04470 [Plasmodium vivax North Korean]|uniref:Variable surface protein Vir35 n=1 Tax=Plasmodium vivax North Korean TaxID=1035514 RepID=A0A0J9WFD9_PLAVI|nr:hypothetical protein PVNG_04470 [Plasmodium vivax North Korean]
MMSLSNYYQGINLKFTTFFKTFTFIFLIWTYASYKDMNKYGHGKILNRNHHRLLAKHELHRELKYAGKGGQLLQHSIGKSKKNVTDNISIRSQLNKKGSNNVETYMKNYKRRYEKKKGLSKLDCYCEKKVFDNMNYIEMLSNKMRSDKKGFKKYIYEKFGISFIILTLIPAVGLIYYILFGCGKGLRGVFLLCGKDNHYTSQQHTESECKNLDKYIWQTTLENIEIFNFIFSFTIITICLLFFIYILIKVIKYEKIKAGKGKMNRREYIDFCKKVFKNEKY